MSGIQFHTAISSARYTRYVSACRCRMQMARALYRANIKLSKELYGVIGMFEIVLRNSVNRHMTVLRGDEWLREAISSGGYLTGIGCEQSALSIQTAVDSLGDKYAHDKLVAKLSFGFWTYLFAARPYAAADSTLLEIFPFRPLGTNQKRVFKELVKINEIRNRIAHYEPICFEREAISTVPTTKRYNLILELLKWMNCHPRKILYGIDQVPKALNAINRIRLSL